MYYFRYLFLCNVISTFAFKLKAFLSAADSQVQL